MDYEYISSEALPEDLTSKEKHKENILSRKPLKSDPMEYSAPWEKGQLNSKESKKKEKLIRD